MVYVSQVRKIVVWMDAWTSTTMFLHTSTQKEVQRKDERIRITTKTKLKVLQCHPHEYCLEVSLFFKEA